MSEVPTSSLPPIQPDITDYLVKLASAHPQIESIWLIGSRANPTGRPPVDWDFLIFATPDVLASLRNDHSFRRTHIDLLVVTDGDFFECPWPHGDRPAFKSGYLRNYYPADGGIVLGWQWKRISEHEARYTASKSMFKDVECRAFRVYERNA